MGKLRVLSGQQACGILAANGRHADALAFVDRSLKEADGATAYELSTACAAGHAATVEWRERYGALAVRCLGRAGELGYFRTPGSAARLETQPAFAKLRGRPDWQALKAALAVPQRGAEP